MELIPAKTILSADTGGGWFGGNYNMNLYKGCCHGCIYCDSRSECYNIEEFDRVRAKKDALALLERDLRSKSKNGVVSMGAMSDPYNPHERKYELTRGALALIDRYRFGAAFATKSDLAVRDIDLLQKISRHSPVVCKFTITAYDDSLSRKVEPNVCPTSKRWEAVRAFSESGLFTGILMMPILPFVEDSEENVIGIINQARKNGAHFIYPSFGVTLRDKQRVWFLEQLDQRFPEAALRERYIREYGDSYFCVSPCAEALWELFQKECRQAGILYRMDDIVRASQRRVPTAQISLFD
jgi:DNA repair photolyase